MKNIGHKINVFIVTLCVIILTVFLGACSVPDAITPCYIPPEIIESTDVQIPLIPFMPFTSLFDARYVKTKMHYQYLLHTKLIDNSILTSEQFQQKLFEPGGVLSMLLPGSMFATLGIFTGGRFLKSPREKELETKVANGNKETS
jgi:tRNA U38,U39,U40 pseudouridine synthase TruA